MTVQIEPRLIVSLFRGVVKVCSRLKEMDVDVFRLLPLLLSSDRNWLTYQLGRSLTERRTFGHRV